MIYNKILDSEIRKNEISDVIKHIKNGKATGYDNICIEMIKSGLPIFIDILEELYNVIFKRGIYPKEWSVSFIIPIYQKNSMYDKGNYREISVYSVMAKIFSSACVE